MSDFSKRPEELTLIPVDGIPEGDVCDGCYYYCANNESCQHPELSVVLDECTKLAEEDAPELYENFIFVEVAQ